MSKALEKISVIPQDEPEHDRARRTRSAVDIDKLQQLMEMRKTIAARNAERSTWL
jgi:hypothetical protein